MPGSDGWDESAGAWIASLGDEGDYGRRYVLDAPMLARLRDRGFQTALDVGCGEGRFCRSMQTQGIRTVGVDPTAALIARARELDSAGDYRTGSAENLNVEPGSFDLVVSYLSLIDMPDLPAAAANMTAALRPGGTLLLGNCNSFHTAGRWMAGRFEMDNYLEERAMWESWRGIRVVNWHRPLSTYMTAFLDNGLQLRHFAEPSPTGGDPVKGARYRRVPYFHIMEWSK